MRNSTSVLVAALACLACVIGWTQLPAAGESARPPVLPLGVVTGTAGTVTPTGTPAGTVTAIATPTGTPSTGAGTPTGTPVMTGTAVGTATSSPGATLTGSPAVTGTASPARTPTGGGTTTPGTPAGTRTGTPSTGRPTNTPSGFVIEDDGCQVVQSSAAAWHLAALGLALAGLRRRRR